MKTDHPDQDNPQAESPEETSSAGQTRREFIRGLLIKTAYAAPIITTFSVATVKTAGADSSSKKKVSRMGMGMGMGGSSDDDSSS